MYNALCLEIQDMMSTVCFRNSVVVIEIDSWWEVSSFFHQFDPPFLCEVCTWVWVGSWVNKSWIGKDIRNLVCRVNLWQERRAARRSSKRCMKYAFGLIWRGSWFERFRELVSGIFAQICHRRMAQRKHCTNCIQLFFVNSSRRGTSWCSVLNIDCDIRQGWHLWHRPIITFRDFVAS